MVLIVFWVSEQRKNIGIVMSKNSNFKRSKYYSKPLEAVTSEYEILKWN